MAGFSVKQKNAQKIIKHNLSYTCVMLQCTLFFYMIQRSKRQNESVRRLVMVKTQG